MTRGGETERGTPYCETLCWMSVRRRNVEPFSRMPFGTTRDGSELAAASERKRRGGPPSRRGGSLRQRDFQCSFKAIPRGDFNKSRRLRVSTPENFGKRHPSPWLHSAIIASYSNVGESPRDPAEISDVVAIDTVYGNRLIVMSTIPVIILLPD